MRIVYSPNVSDISAFSLFGDGVVIVTQLVFLFPVFLAAATFGLWSVESLFGRTYTEQSQLELEISESTEILEPWSDF